MSRFKYICEYKSEGKTYKIYKDKQTNEYYKMNGTFVKKVNSDDVRIAEIANYFIKDKEEEKAKKSAKTTTAAIIGSLVILEILGSYTFHKFKADVPTEDVVEEKTMEQDHTLKALGRKDYLYRAVNANDSIKDKNINEYVETLARMDIEDVDYILLASRFKNYNFKDEEITTEDLNNIFALNDDGFVASELYCYVHKIKNVSYFAMTSDILTGEKDVIRRLFAKENLNDILSEKVGADVTVGNMYKNLQARGTLMVKRDKYNDFSGILQNNIFNEFICLNVNDHYNTYYKEEENGYLKDVTYEYYVFELTKKINSVENLDYTNADDRKLLYFYASANLNGAHMSDITDEIVYGSMNAIYDWDSLDIYDLFGHLSNYDFNYHKLVSLSRLSEYEIALPLLQEVNMCLKEEVKLGNLTETEYQLFIDDVLDGLMQHGNDDYLRFIEADRKNESIDDFKLHFKKGL